jgi:phage terminase large subunit GpA-like protein
MFAANSELLRHVRGERVSNIFIGKQTVMDHMIQYIGWPTTPQALADKPCCYIIADETGKYPPFVGLEADPISLMRKRQRWFKGRSKLLGMTTPVTAGDMSDTEWSRGDCCQWWVRCGQCKKWHQLEWENVQIDRIAGKSGKRWYAESVYHKGRHARYVCPHCRGRWSEEDRWRAVCGGRFVPADCSIDDSGDIVGEVAPTSYRSCRIHALMLHPMVETVTSLVIEFVRAQRAKQAGNIEPLKDFWNSQLARPWREERAVTSIDILRTHIGSYPKGKVPVGAQMLTAGFDVQLDHVFMRVLGWGYLGEFWSIFEQRIETGPTDRVENLEKLMPYLVMEFDLLEDANKYKRITLSGIDRMFNTETVDAFCVKCAGVAAIIPVAGDDKLSRQSWRVGKAAGGRLSRYDLNVTGYKDGLHRSYFEATASGPGYGHLHRDTEHIVLEHLTSEKKVIERKAGRIAWIGWKEKSPGRANHYWDCDVYARAVAEIAGLYTLPDPAVPKKDVTPIGRPVKRRPIRTKY